MAVYLAKNEEPEGPYKLGKWSFRKACASLPHSFRENRQVYLQIVGLMMANDVPLRALVRRRIFRTASGMPKKSVMSNVDYKILTRNKKLTHLVLSACPMNQIVTHVRGRVCATACVHVVTSRQVVKQQEARNKCIATSNKCLTSSNKKLVVVKPVCALVQQLRRL